MEKLLSLIDEIETHLSAIDKIDESVSASSVGWHFEHSLLTINRILYQVRKSDPQQYQWKFNGNRLLVFTIQKIPRGRAKAPSVVIPSSFDILSLKRHLEKTRAALKEMHTIPVDCFFDHPFFGKLNRKHTEKFLMIHTQHHLSIMNDINKR